MTDQSTSPPQKLPADAPVSGPEAGISGMPPVAAAAPVLTFSRGTRPLGPRRTANNGQDYRRRIA
ncbi:hypothetical protein [Hymenobacter ruber]